MPYEQNDNSKLTDKATGTTYDAAAFRAGIAMRDEIYGTGPSRIAGDSQNQQAATTRNNLDTGNSDGHNHGAVESASSGKLDAIPAIGDSHNHGSTNQVAVTGADKNVTPIGLDGSTLTSMLQNGALTYQQAIAMSSPELASYLSSFRYNKPNISNGNLF